MIRSNMLNPAIGSYIIYKFVKGYNDYSKSKICFPLIFIALPFVFNKKCRTAAASTRISGGLFGIFNKISDSNKNNDIKLLSRVAKELMELSFDSFTMALATNLIEVEFDNNCSLSATKIDDSCFDKKTFGIGKASYNFGAALSKYTIYEISTLLNVRF